MKWFRSCVLALGCIGCGVGCVSPQQGSTAATTARTVTEAAGEVTRTIDFAFAEIVRRRTASGVSLDAYMAVEEWVFVGLQVASVVSQYASGFKATAPPQ